MSLPISCAPFDQELESIDEFFQRFDCQMSDQLHKVRNDDIKRANLLVKFLPVSVISELQRRISPIQLRDATYDVIEEHLRQQYGTSKSTVGASVQFLTYKQQSGQSIEDYSRKLNSLASQCGYPAECLDRLLRDIFVAGLQSSTVLTTLIQECDKLSFRQTLERAKLLNAFQNDVEKINSSRQKVYSTSEEIQYEDANKVDAKKAIPKDNYLCYRCGVKGKHFSNDCFAKSRKCHQCDKLGHIARICQQSKKSYTQQARDVDVANSLQFTHERRHNIHNFTPIGSASKDPHSFYHQQRIANHTTNQQTSHQSTTANNIRGKIPSHQDDETIVNSSSNCHFNDSFLM